jgi:hypothetical protein
LPVYINYVPIAKLLEADFAITILHRTCVRNMCQKTFA